MLTEGLGHVVGQIHHHGYRLQVGVQFWTHATTDTTRVKKYPKEQNFLVDLRRRITTKSLGLQNPTLDQSTFPKIGIFNVQITNFKNINCSRVVKDA